MPTLIENLKAIEHDLDFKYPPSFIANIQTLIDLTQSPSFGQFMPQAKLLLTLTDVKTAFSSGLPTEYIPFLLEKQLNHIDFYAFNTKSTAPEYCVVAFAIHTNVQEWENFDAFLAWLNAL
jgi:hypothetical protein